MSARVALVGAGPGHPDHLTLRAVGELAAAELVVADREVLALGQAFAPQARIEATCSDQGDISSSLVRSCRAGHRTVRLYRGDAWTHRAFAADRAALVRSGIEPTVVPGPVTELALAAEAGVAVHHRPRAVTVTIGHASVLATESDPARTLLAESADLHADRSQIAGDPAEVAVVQDGVAAPIGSADLRGVGVVVVGAVVASAVTR